MQFSATKNYRNWCITNRAVLKAFVVFNAHRVVLTGAFSIVQHVCVANVQDITELYHISPDDVLGSGQFGVVYGGKEILSIICSTVQRLKTHVEKPVLVSV